jgi:hypothetical protein
MSEGRLSALAKRGKLLSEQEATKERVRSKTYWSPNPGSALRRQLKEALDETAPKSSVWRRIYICAQEHLKPVFIFALLCNSEQNGTLKSQSNLGKQLTLEREAERWPDETLKILIKKLNKVTLHRKISDGIEKLERRARCVSAEGANDEQKEAREKTASLVQQGTEGPSMQTVPVLMLQNVSTMHIVRLELEPQWSKRANGLIKMKWDLPFGPNIINDFCKYWLVTVQYVANSVTGVHALCPGRSILKDNAYLNEVFTAAQSDESTMLAMTVVSAAYLKDYLLPGSGQRSAIAGVEKTALLQLKEVLRHDSPSPAWMLIIHHAIVFPEVYKRPWTDLLLPFRCSGQQSDVVIASHSIFLSMFLPVGSKYKFQGNDYSWLVDGDENTITKIHGIVGLSQRMLRFIDLITIEATKITTRPQAANNTQTHGLLEYESLLQDIETSPQWLDDHEDPEVARIARMTADAFRLATLIYALVRLYG